MTEPLPHAATASVDFSEETTDAGTQSLVPGVPPITAADRLRWRADAPLAPRKAQRPCDLGLFDDAARSQLDFFIHGGG